MSQVISVRDIQEMIRTGQGVNIPADAIVTPSARELLQDIETTGARAIATGTATAAPVTADKLSPPTKKLSVANMSARRPKSRAYSNVCGIPKYAGNAKSMIFIANAAHRPMKRQVNIIASGTVRFGFLTSSANVVTPSKPM